MPPQPFVLIRKAGGGALSLRASQVVAIDGEGAQLSILLAGGAQYQVVAENEVAAWAARWALCEAEAGSEAAA